MVVRLGPFGPPGAKCAPGGLPASWFGYLSSPSRPVEAGTDGLTLAIEPLRT